MNLRVIVYLKKKLSPSSVYLCAHIICNLYRVVRLWPLYVGNIHELQEKWCSLMR